MSKLITNRWQRASGDAFERSIILRHDSAPEGLDVERVRFVEAGPLGSDPRGGHLVSVLAGRARDAQAGLDLGAGVHLYVPPGHPMTLEAQPGTEIVRVSSPTPQQARGERLLVRDEAFVSACTAEGQPLRWVLTPQYLSRRLFLHHDRTLLSRAGHPVSWFHTTMFEVSGLPPNDEGESVFKMSYNSRTEFNVLYEVTGQARVRMARHPYDGRQWDAWQTLNGDTTYHLNEAAGGAEEERVGDRCFRNKHEVFSRDGHVSLMCMFDPAPTGIERHQPGEYSDYEPYDLVSARPEYRVHQREIARFDAMVDRLSLAKARGELEAQRGTPEWACFLEGKAAQAAIEAALVRALSDEGAGREKVIERWLSRDV